MSAVFEALLRYAESTVCAHEATHRGGAIWTICDDCAMKWADDEGGMPAFEWPKEIIASRAALATQPAATDKLVAKVLSYTSGSYSRNYKLEWLENVPEGALLYAAPLLQPAAPAEVVARLKDHQIASLVNELRDIAVEFHGAQQLRERISHRVHAALASPAPSGVQSQGPEA